MDRLDIQRLRREDLPEETEALSRYLIGKTLVWIWTGAGSAGALSKLKRIRPVMLPVGPLQVRARQIVPCISITVMPMFISSMASTTC